MAKTMSRRMRASTPRTKTGCANCRQRRIKCDKADPGCERCRRSGWSCPGYTLASISTSSTDSLVMTTSADDASSITQYSLPFKVPGSQEERRALHYFCNFAAADLTGYIPSGFWVRTVLQRCQHDVPIRHAAAALGRVHREYVAGTEGFTASDDSVEAYRKSVKALRNYLGRQINPDRALVLICSAIFFCFELVRGDRRSALRHLHSGLEILNEWQQEPQIELALVETKEELIGVFARLDLQATIFDDGRVPVLQIDGEMQGHCDPTSETLMSPFTSVDEVQQCLFPLLHTAFSFLVQSVPYKFANGKAVPTLVVHDRRKLLERFNLWDRRLRLFEQQKRTENASTLNDQRRVISASKLHYLTINLLLLQCLQDDTMESAPSFDGKAEYLLELARDVISGDTELTPSATTGTARRCFYLHLGIVAPIFLLAMKTSRPQIVQAATELLQAASGRREGFYDAQQMALLTKRLAHRQDGVKSLEPYVSVEGQVLAGQSTAPSLEWMAEEIMEVQMPNYCHDEEERWKGYDRLLALVA